MQRSFGAARRRAVGTPLSDDDRDVLERIAAGWTNREIADDLGLTHNVVRMHVRRLQGKLDARGRAGVVGQAHRAGLLGSAPVGAQR